MTRVPTLTRLAGWSTVVLLVAVTGCTSDTPGSGPAAPPSASPTAATSFTPQDASFEPIVTGYEVTLCARANGFASFPDPTVTADNVTWPGVTSSDLGTIFDLCKYAVERLPDAARATIPAKTPAAGPFADPFDYCAAIGTRNAPDARYTGPAKPPAILSGLRAMLRLDPNYDNATFEKQTSWRCVRGEVVACSFADQSSCSAKASLAVLNTGEPAIQQYCTANPDVKAIPKSVDVDQIYEFACVKGKPTVSRIVTPLDADGFITSVWHKITKTG